MAGLIYQLFSSSSLLLLGLYHLICSTFNLMKTPQSYIAKPYHPFPRLFSSSSTLNGNNHHYRLKHLQLYLIIVFLLIAFAHQTLIAFYADPLVKGSSPVHRFSSLQSAAVLFLFILVAVSILLSDSAVPVLNLPSDLHFGLASAAFYLHYSISSSAAAVQTSDLQAECDKISAGISAVCSLLTLILACRPKLFVADIGLAAAVCLQGLWQFQMGLSLYVDGFIPDGCHKLLDVVSGVESSTKCDVEESRLRAVAILDLMFVIHVTIAVAVVFLTYAIVAKLVGMRRMGSYEALPTNSADSNHIQMKSLTGTQA